MDDMEQGGQSSRALLWAVLGVVALALVVGAIVVIGGDDDEVATEGTTSTTAAPTTTTPAPTTTAPATTTSTPSTTASTTTTPVVVPDAYRTAVWPWYDDDLRYDDPVEAARGFAEDFIGFADPVVGEFQQGDSRSGEVEVRPVEDGPVTTVLVRQVGDDDTWWVLGSATANIEVDLPTAMSAVDDPLLTEGRASAFEGTVEVEIRVDGEPEPLGTGFVTGSGDATLGPFEGEIRWPNPGGGWGAVVFLTRSAENGQVWEAGVLRVGFIGGD
jgi:hypothetical protein